MNLRLPTIAVIQSGRGRPQSNDAIARPGKTSRKGKGSPHCDPDAGGYDRKPISSTVKVYLSRGGAEALRKHRQSSSQRLCRSPSLRRFLLGQLLGRTHPFQYPLFLEAQLVLLRIRVAEALKARQNTNPGCSEAW